jgi:hypothetical protein
VSRWQCSPLRGVCSGRDGHWSIAASCGWELRGGGHSGSSRSSGPRRPACRGSSRASEVGPVQRRPDSSTSSLRPPSS